MHYTYYKILNTRTTNLIGVLGDDGGIESEGPRAAAELLAGRGRGGGGLPVSRLRHVAVHETSGIQKQLDGEIRRLLCMLHDVMYLCSSKWWGTTIRASRKCDVASVYRLRSRSTLPFRSSASADLKIQTSIQFCHHS